jgi:hypothetical protein
MDGIAPDEISTRADLAGGLIALFSSTGETISGIAATAKLSKATVSGIVHGDTRIPHTDTLKLFVAACGENPVQWVAARGRVVQAERETRSAAPSSRPIHEMTSIDAVDDRHARVLMLVDRASQRPMDDQRRELLSIALQTARSITDSRACARVLAEMSPALEPDQRRQALMDALSFTRSLPDADVRGKTLAEIAEYLDSDHLGQALDIAAALAESNHTYALARMGKHLKSSDDESICDLRVKALRIASEINDDVTRAHTLEDLVPYLDHDQLTEVLESVPRISNDFSRAGLLHQLAQHLDRDQRNRALTLACSIPSESARAQALAYLGPYLSPDQLTAAIAAAEDIDSKAVRRPTLAALRTLQPDRN